jgi:hypothetical protein
MACKRFCMVERLIHIFVFFFLLQGMMVARG